MSKETVSIRLDPDTIKNIEKAAEKDQRTISDYLRLLIEKMF